MADINETESPKTQKSKTYLNIPIQRELRNKLKAKAALKGKSLYDYCTEILEEALNKEGEIK
jgi:predicted HicB family RNase H-like nuclease